MTCIDVDLNHDVQKDIGLTSQEHMILKSIEKFYECEKNIKIFMSMINSKKNTSIRLIDHFITKFSKHSSTSYKLIENNIETTFNIFASYRQQLKAFQKKHFDPFSRGDRIPYFIDNTCIITTIGQLNFFKWFISKKIHEHVKNNYKIIYSDMNKKIKGDNKNCKKQHIKNKTNSKKSMSTNYNSSYKYNVPNTCQTMTKPKVDRIIIQFK